MHAEIPKISDNEYEIMKIIWEHSPMKSQEIIEKVDSRHGWNEKTIRTMINRLLKKEAIGYEKDGKSYLYYPLIEKSSYRKMENNSFLQRVYNGSVNSMVLNFVKDLKLSRKEIEDLKNILDDEVK